MKYIIENGSSKLGYHITVENGYYTGIDYVVHGEKYGVFTYKDEDIKLYRTYKVAEKVCNRLIEQLANVDIDSLTIKEVPE